MVRLLQRIWYAQADRGRNGWEKLPRVNPDACSSDAHGPDTVRVEGGSPALGTTGLLRFASRRCDLLSRTAAFVASGGGLRRPLVPTSWLWLFRPPWLIEMSCEKYRFITVSVSGIKNARHAAQGGSLLKQAQIPLTRHSRHPQDPTERNTRPWRAAENRFCW